MPLANHEIIECPACKQKLMSRALRCHFCGASTREVKRVENKKSYKAFETPTWVKVMYVIVSCWWIFSGLLFVGQVVTTAMNRKPDIFGFSRPGMGTGDYILVVFGIVETVIGVAMLLKVNWARGVVNFLSFLKGLGAVVALLPSWAVLMIRPGMGALLILTNLVDLAAAVLTVWLISATETSFG